MARAQDLKSGDLVMEESSRFTAAGSLCRQNLKYENFTLRLADYVKKMALKSLSLTSSHLKHRKATTVATSTATPEKDDPIG